MVPYDDHVVGFVGEKIKDYIEFYTTFGDGKNNKTIIRYLVINANTLYNIFLGLMAIVSTPHLKFLSTSGDILTMHVDQKVA